MEYIYTTTKRGERMFNSYFEAKYRRINQCYKKFSFTKQLAESRYISMMHEEGGYDFRIIAWNKFQFTCGWRSKTGDLRIETTQKSYLVINLPF